MGWRSRIRPKAGHIATALTWTTPGRTPQLPPDAGARLTLATTAPVHLHLCNRPPSNPLLRVRTSQSAQRLARRAAAAISRKLPPRCGKQACHSHRGATGPGHEPCLLNTANLAIQSPSPPGCRFSHDLPYKVVRYLLSGAGSSKARTPHSSSFSRKTAPEQQRPRLHSPPLLSSGPKLPPLIKNNLASRSQPSS